MIEHPGIVLATSLDANGISIPNFAKEIGLTLSELQTILNGRAPITETLAIRIGAYFGTGNGTHWIRQQTAYDEYQNDDYIQPDSLRENEDNVEHDTNEPIY